MASNVNISKLPDEATQNFTEGGGGAPGYFWGFIINFCLSSIIIFSLYIVLGIITQHVLGYGTILKSLVPPRAHGEFMRSAVAVYIILGYIISFLVTKQISKNKNSHFSIGRKVSLFVSALICIMGVCIALFLQIRW